MTQTTSETYSPPLRLPVLEVVSAAGLALAYVVAAEVGHWLSFEPGHIATFWPPSGLLLIALISAPKRRWPVLLVAAGLANAASDLFIHHQKATFALSMLVGNEVEAVLGAWWIQKFSKESFSLERLSDLKRLLLVAFCAPLISGLIVTPSALWHLPIHFLDFYPVWWIADCVGILIVAPLTWAILLGKLTRPESWLRGAELIASYATLAGCGFVVFGGWLGDMSFPFLVMPLLYWPALRFGTVVVASHVALLAVIVAMATQDNFGPIAEAVPNWNQRAVIVQAFLAVCSVPFLALAAMWHERQQAAAEMERRIEQRTYQLAEADRRKDHFLAVLAHELRNPLAPLSHALDVWPTVVDQTDKLEELRQVMVNQVRHMCGLIDDLLDVSRIAGGKILLRKQFVDLREVVRIAFQGVESQARAVGHSLHIELPSRPIWVHGDRARLCQIVGNLLHNAIKYTGHNGKISVSAIEQNGRATVTVCDNGPGIPPHDLERIFELFTQVDQTLERSHGGLGIGLTLVKNLVELHGGTVRAESAGLGRGSTFHVTLPCKEPLQGQGMGSTESSSTNAGPSPGAGLPARRILVVDDTQASGRMLALLLKSLGQQVEICFDGPAALSLVETYQPSLIFLDIAMPGMSGYEVASLLKASATTRHITLVAMTGFGQASDRQRAFDAGFDHHMVKPATLDGLKEVICSC